MLSNLNQTIAYKKIEGGQKRPHPILVATVTQSSSAAQSC